MVSLSFATELKKMFKKKSNFLDTNITEKPEIVDIYSFITADCI